MADQVKKPRAPRKPRTTKAVEPPPVVEFTEWAHEVIDGKHAPPDVCSACRERVVVRDKINLLIAGHPLDNIVMLADFLAYIAIQAATPQSVEELDDALLMLPILSQFSSRLAEWTIQLQRDTQLMQGTIAKAPTRTM